jgi:hypothetical protein
VARAVPGRRLADDRAERAAERSEAAEANVEAHVGHASIRFAQQEHRAFDPPALEVSMGCLPEDGPEGAAEVGRRDVGHLGHGLDIEWLGVGSIHRVAGAQEAPVQVFGFTAHGETLPDRAKDPRDGLAEPDGCQHVERGAVGLLAYASTGGRTATS